MIKFSFMEENVGRMANYRDTTEMSLLLTPVSSALIFLTKKLFFEQMFFSGD